MSTIEDDLALPISRLAVSWLILIPLFFYACRGILWFQAAGGNTLSSTGFGSMGASKGGGEVEIFLTISSCVLLMVLTRIVSISELVWRNKVFAVLALYALASCLWSQVPRLSLQYGVDIVLNVLFAFYLCARFRTERIMQLLAITGWIAVLGSIIFAVALPRYGVDHRASTAGAWQGIFVYKNTCSIMVTFLLSAGFYLPVRNRRDKLLRVAYVLLAIFLVIMTRARTGWILLAGLLAYVSILKLVSSFKTRDRIAVVALIAMVAVPLAVGGALFYTEILLLLGKNPTLTGRTDIWKLAVVSAMKHPWIGYGYRAFWLGLRGESATASLHLQWTVPGSHNGLLEAWLDLGLIGLGLFGYTLVRAIRNAIVCFKQGASRRVQWYGSILVMMMIVNIAEMTIMSPNYLTWMMYVMACIGLDSEARYVSSQAYA